MYTDTKNVENGMYDYTKNTWSLQNSKKGLKKNLESKARNIQFIHGKRRLCLDHHVLQFVPCSLSCENHLRFKRRSIKERKGL